MPIHAIDVASGAVAFDQPDVGLPGILPLSFIRHYSTENLLREGVLGPGWSHNFDHRLHKTLEGWRYTDERGIETQIVGRFRGGIELVEKDDRTVWLRRYTSGNPKLWFVFVRRNSHYELREMRLTERQRLRLHRRHGRLENVEHVRSGRQLCFEYDPVQERIVRVLARLPGQDRHEQIVHYAYDHAGRLHQIVDRGDQRTSFEYNEWGCVTKERKPTGSEYTFEYDARCRCIHVNGTDGFEERWLSYDDSRRTTTVTDRRDNVTTYVSNAYGQILEEHLANGARTKRSYDEQGNLVLSAGPLGNKVQRSYDEHGRLCEIRDPLRKRSWKIGYDESHRVTSVEIPTGDVWSYTYDTCGFLNFTTGPDGHVWHYVYTDDGELCAVVDPEGNKATRSYDAHGNVVETDAAGRQRKFEYDPWGRPTTIHDTDGSKTHKKYNGLGRLVEISTSAGLRLQYQHDEGGRVIERKGPGGTYRAKWMGCGCLHEVIRPDGSTVRMQWGDEPGQLRQLEDPQGKTISWDYDVVGRPTNRKHYDGGQIDIEYDLAGNPVRVVDQDGRVFQCTFDADNNLVSYTTPSGETTEYTYDILDRLVRVVRGGTELVFERDAYGAINSEALTFEGTTTILARVRDGMGRPTQLRIDGLRPTTWTYRGAYVSNIQHGDNTWEIEYDNLGRMVQNGTFKQEYDNAGRVVRQLIENSMGSVEYLYDTESMEIVSGQTRQGFEVDECERLSTWQWEDPSTGPRIRVHRQHDPAGNFQTETLDAGVFSNKHDNDVHHNRVQRVWDPYRDCVVLYEYDKHGRVVQRQSSHECCVFEWTDDGLLLAATVDGQRWTYAYDPLGRRIRKTSPTGKAWRYYWDDSRIAGIEASDGDRIEYIYLPNDASSVAFQTQERTWNLLCRPDGTPISAHDHKGRTTPLRAHLDPWGRPFADIQTKQRMGFPGQEGFLGSPGQILDPETGLYYNVHRYYDPALSAFISPDPCGLLGGLNDYAWVKNPLAWIDPLGLRYISGGPMPWNPMGTPRDPNGRPNLADPENRFVDVLSPNGNTKSYKVKDRGNSHNGKCLAVADGIPSSALPTDRGFTPGDTPAFVSGQGFPDPVPIPDFGVRTDQMGNWCHAEIQGLWFLVQNDISGATLWVDRPPCGLCAGDLDRILDAHFPGGDGRSVTVMYCDPEAGWLTWDEYKSRKHPPCGG